jgi:hypothetical protein
MPAPFQVSGRFCSWKWSVFIRHLPESSVPSNRRQPSKLVKMRTGRRSCGAIFAAATTFFSVTVAAFAFGLSDEDYDYLKTQHIERSDAPILDLSPKERARVHNLINDPQTAGDPIARDRNVKDALGLFLEHQLWEKAHPGELWDAPR